MDKRGAAIERAERYRQHAAELRIQAQSFRNPDARQRLIETAARLESMAERLEQG